jgi:hypothetical protein
VGGGFLPAYMLEQPVQGAVAELLQGHTFKPQVLSYEVRQSEMINPLSFCNPGGLHAAVVLRLVELNEAIAAADKMAINSQVPALNDASRRALGCAPADAFAWLIMFWLDADKNGINASNLYFLRLS